MKHYIKKSIKRIVSTLLVFAMLVGCLSSLYALEAQASPSQISHAEMKTTIDLLHEVVYQNIEGYGIKPTKADTYKAYIDAAKALKYDKHSEPSEEDPTVTVEYPDKILDVPVQKVIDQLISDYNKTGQATLTKKQVDDKAEATTELATLNSDLTKFNTELTNLKTQKTAKQAALKTAQDELDKLDKDDKANAKKIENKEKEIRNIKTEISELDTKIKEQETKIKEQNAKITAQTAYIAGIDTDNAYKFNNIVFDATRAKNYSGGVLRGTYLVSDLMNDYIREHSNPASTLYDSKITEFVQAKMTTANPDVNFKNIIKDIVAYVKETNTEYANYSDVEYIDTFAGEHTITYNDYLMQHGAPSTGTLFIGTYLIDASAINDVYYRYAVDSMGTMAQNIMYYKSELDDGHWKDIVSAAGLSDILPMSTNVQEDADFKALRVCCVIGADGIPRFPDTLEPCDIFNFTEPYDMTAIPELVKLKLMFDAQVVSQNTSDLSNRYTADLLYRFFNYDGVGDNKSMMILRNRGYRDYVYDHPNETAQIIGKNPVDMFNTYSDTGSVVKKGRYRRVVVVDKLPTTDAQKKAILKVRKMNDPVNFVTFITKDEIKYVTELQNKALNLSCNMAQTEKRYVDHQDAWIDQILSWTEYYGNYKFDKANTDTFTNRSITPTMRDGHAVPTILPGEAFYDSQWERLNWRSTNNPQSYMFIMCGNKGKLSTGDQKDFVDKWLSDTYLHYPKGQRVTKYRSDGTSYTEDVDLDIYLKWSSVKDYSTKMNDVFYATTGLNEQNGATNTTIVYGSKWKSFQDLMYRYMDWLHFMYDIRDDITYNCDNELETLNKLYVEVRGDPKRRDEADTLMTLMSKIDAERRAEIYNNLVLDDRTNKNDTKGKHNVVMGPTLMNLMDLLMDGKGDVGQNYSFISGDDDGGSYASNDAILTAVEDAVEACQIKYNEYHTQALYDSSGLILKHAEYEISRKILDPNSTANQRKALLSRLAVLFNIESGGITDRVAEKNEINGLIETAQTYYADAIHDKASNDYLTVAQDPSASKGTLRSYLEIQKDEANGKVAQLQSLIGAYCLRSNTSEGILFINRRLDWAENQLEGIRMDDPFGAFAKESLDEHIKWLKDILAKVKNGTYSGDGFSAEGEGIDRQAELLNALDNNDWELAEKIDSANRNGSGNGNGSGNDEGDGTAGAGDISGGIGGDDNPFDPIIQDLESKLINDPDGGDKLKPTIQALGELGDANLPNLKSSFEARGVGQDILDTFDKAIKTANNNNLNPYGKNRTGTNNGGGNGTGGSSGQNGGNGEGGEGVNGQGGGAEGDGVDNGGGYGDGSGLSDDDLKNLIEDIFGKPLEELDDDELAVVVYACTKYGQTNNYAGIMEFGRGVMYMALDKDNPYFYHQLVADTTSEYVNLAAVDKPRVKTGYRYVKLGRTVTMTKVAQIDMSQSYSFTFGSKKVENRGGNTAELLKNLLQQTDPYVRGSLTKNYAYLDAEDARLKLGILCKYIPQSEFAVFLAGDMSGKADTFYAAIDEAVQEAQAALAAAQSATSRSNSSSGNNSNGSSNQ